MNPLLDPALRLVVAHRGDRAHAPENTIASFARALAIGADAIEFDVRMSRDAVPVVIHDATVDRTTAARGRVGSYTARELTALRATAERAGDDAVTVPLLEEVFDRFRDVPMVIEVKELAAVEATAAMVARFGARDRVLIGSANEQVMRRFYATDLACCAASSDARRLVVTALLGIVPRAPAYDVISVTPRYGGVPIPVKRIAAVGRRAGLPTQVWTVNDPEQARAFWIAGVAAIVTDDPAAMLRARSQ